MERKTQGDSHRHLMTDIGKFLAFVLRHRPDEVGLDVDEHGWANVDDLISCVRASHYPLDRDLLEEIVRSDEKRRYSFDADHARIRANQGHSFPVDLGLSEQEPPAILYHGTATRFSDSIDRQGLLPQGRLYVHLSPDEETATKVGSRHGRPMVYRVDCQAMVRDGYGFYLSENGVWLTKEVPARYLIRPDEEA